jgi:DNA polymerase-3 subunit gamma/tau
MESANQEFLVTARKWRPLKFHDVVGQQHITSTLQNAVRSGRIHHAYLFSGPRGVGKTTTARILARAINCTNPKDFEPCNECESCKAIIDGRSLDVIEIDGASNNSVEDIRKLRDNSRYLPANGKYKMYIIDEVHMLSTSAFNALLKTLEEPPPHLLFVFATTEPHKVLATILSRCQRFEFKRMEIDDIVRQLKVISEREKIEVDENCLITIAKKGDGSMRDSQSIFDQVVAFCGNKIEYSNMADALHLVDQEFFFRISDDIKDKNLTDIFVLTKEILTKGYDLQECMEGLVEHFRNVLAVKVTDRTDLIESSADVLKRYKSAADSFTKSDILRLLSAASSAEQALKYASQPRIKFETALIQMASMESVIDLNELIKGIDDLKKNSSLNLTPSDNSNLNLATPAIAPVADRRISTRPIINESTVTSQNSTRNSVADSTGASRARLQEGWDEFVSLHANSETGLYLLKQKNSVFPAFRDSEIIIKVGLAFLKQNLDSKKQDLIDRLKEFYNADVKVKIIDAAKGETDEFDDAGVQATESYELLDDEPAYIRENMSPADLAVINKEKEIASSNTVEVKTVNEEDLSPIEKKLTSLFGAQLTA